MLVGQKKAVAIAVRDVFGRRRDPAADDELSQITSSRDVGVVPVDDRNPSNSACKSGVC